MLYKSCALGAAAALLLVSGCGGSPAAPAPAPATQAPAPVATKDVVESPAPAPAPAAAPAAPEASAPVAPAPMPAASTGGDPGGIKLIGTTWRVSDFDIEFKDATNVHLNGGPLTMMTAGRGADGTFSCKEGIVELKVLGQVKAGTWDGENLVIENTQGTKK